MLTPEGTLDQSNRGAAGGHWSLLITPLWQENGLPRGNASQKMRQKQTKDKVCLKTWKTENNSKCIDGHSMILKGQSSRRAFWGRSFGSWRRFSAGRNGKTASKNSSTKKTRPAFGSSLRCHKKDGLIKSNSVCDRGRDGHAGCLVAGEVKKVWKSGNF